eukprot:1488203-Amphidinium_carterae.1
MAVECFTQKWQSLVRRKCTMTWDGWRAAGWGWFGTGVVGFVLTGIKPHRFVSELDVCLDDSYAQQRIGKVSERLKVPDPMLWRRHAIRQRLSTIARN